MTTVIGVDGCRDGWFYFRSDGGAIISGVAGDFAGLVEGLPPGARVFIDIPIGLNDSDRDGRECDRLARRALGSPRASSVFSAPAFPVLAATNYEDAKRKSDQAIGKKLSRQAFAIIPKIKEVNEYLAANRNSSVVVREVHPELCFWGLNGGAAMQHTKKKRAGFDERLQLLQKFLPNAQAQALVQDALKNHKRSEVARDDIIDALVALVTGCTADDKLITLPANPPLDLRGLAMEIVYTEQPSRALASKFSDSLSPANS